jgi:hypothetical protein
VTRTFVLYLRSRSAPASLATMLGCAVGLWALGLAVDDSSTRVRLALLITALAIAAIAPGLAGADADLERIPGFAWPPRRAAHLVIAGVVAFGLMAAAALAGDPVTGTARIARDAAGLTGLLGLGAVALGASRAPLLPLLWTALAVGLPTTDRPAYKAVITWMMLPTTIVTATLTAVVVGATGVLAYSVAGPRR